MKPPPGGKGGGGSVGFALRLLSSIDVVSIVCPFKKPTYSKTPMERRGRGERILCSRRGGAARSRNVPTEPRPACPSDLDASLGTGVGPKPGTGEAAEAGDAAGGGPTARGVGYPR